MNAEDYEVAHRLRQRIGVDEEEISDQEILALSDRTIIGALTRLEVRWEALRRSIQEAMPVRPFRVMSKPTAALIVAAIMAIAGTAVPEPQGVPYFVLAAVFSACGTVLALRDIFGR